MEDDLYVRREQYNCLILISQDLQMSYMLVPEKTLRHNSLFIPKVKEAKIE